jgi:HEAT repeat protein
MLEQKLPEGDPRVARAIRALWPAERATAVLIRALATTAPADRVGAARALRSASEQTSLDAMRTTLFDEHASIDARMAAADAIGEIDGAPANFSLKAALDEPVPNLRKRAAELLFRRTGLERLAGDSASGAALLGRLLRDSDARVNGRAVAELKRVVESGSAEMAGYRNGDTPEPLKVITSG